MPAPRGVADCLYGECRWDRPRPSADKWAVVREHPGWSAVGCENKQTNQWGARRHPDHSTACCQGWQGTAATRDDRKRIVVDVEPTRSTAVCSGCGETKPRIHDIKPARQWRHLDGWNVRTMVRSTVRRVRCRHCGVRVEQVPWARTRSRFTHEFEAEVLRRARDTSILRVCRQLGLHGTSVMRLIERWVEESAERHFRAPLKHIGVDEIRLSWRFSG